MEEIRDISCGKLKSYSIHLKAKRIFVKGIGYVINDCLGSTYRTDTIISG